MDESILCYYSKAVQHQVLDDATNNQLDTEEGKCRRVFDRGKRRTRRRIVLVGTENDDLKVIRGGNLDVISYRII